MQFERQRKCKRFSPQLFEFYLLLLAQHGQHDFIQSLLSRTRERSINLGSTKFLDFFELFFYSLQNLL